MDGLESKPSRIAVLSSSAHSMGSVDLSDLNYTKGRKYKTWEAYGQSKMANILFAKELNARGEGAYIAAAVHPGVIKTNLARHMPKSQLMMFQVAAKVPFLM